MVTRMRGRVVTPPIPVSKRITKNKGRKAISSKNPNRVYLATCVGKLMAYERVDKREEARQWAALLVEHLRKMDLLPPIDTPAKPM